MLLLLLMLTLRLAYCDVGSDELDDERELQDFQRGCFGMTGRGMI